MDILGGARQEMPVILRGKIIEAAEEAGKYIFQDETGQITVNIEEENFTHDPNLQVELTGEVNLKPEESTAEIKVNEIKEMSPSEDIEQPWSKVGSDFLKDLPRSI